MRLDLQITQNDVGMINNFREYRKNRNIIVKKNELKVRAAIKIQSMFRSFKARKATLPKIKARTKALNVVACSIQKIYRQRWSQSNSQENLQNPQESEFVSVRNSTIIEADTNDVESVR